MCKQYPLCLHNKISLFLWQIHTIQMMRFQRIKKGKTKEKYFVEPCSFYSQGVLRRLTYSPQHTLGIKASRERAKFKILQIFEYIWIFIDKYTHSPKYSWIFQSKYIWTFIWDFFLLLNIFGHSFGVLHSNEYIQMYSLNKHFFMQQMLSNLIYLL